MDGEVTQPHVSVGTRRVGAGAACFVIAEAGVNHNGSVDTARALVDAACAAGADAVKFQSFTAASLATLNAPRAEYQRTADGSDSQYEMLRGLELSLADHHTIAEHCRERGILFLSSPFDEDSAALLDRLGVPAFKISSGELTNVAFLSRVARFGRPMILSTGMADLQEVANAVAAVRGGGLDQIVLLHCVSCYPAAPEDVNLRAMHTLASTFAVPVGYSDHTLGPDVALASAALGAHVVEKHLTLDRRQQGPDHAASMEPQEFREMIRGIRSIESALGDGRKVPAAREAAIAAVARRSLVAAADMAAGAVLSDDNIAVLRPGTGIPPAMRGDVVGRTARVPIARGTVLQFDMLI